MLSYQDTIDYLYSRLPLFSRIGAAAIKNDLHNTLAICSFLEHPEKKFKTVHIAGTNGKGSTSHMLASIFQEAGYTTGLYTSPHLYDFRERIKVNGEMCSTQFVIDFTHKMKGFIETAAPSFFEITVGMAFDYFAQQKVDIAIIETGLGGRLDSTNVIIPELSIITNIGWDHMALLGNDLTSIAKEKAGIIKKNVPVVISETISESKIVFEEKAKECDAPIYFAEAYFNLIQFKNHWNTATFEFSCLQKFNETSYFDSSFSIHCDLPGKYQYKNLRGVLTAIQILKKQGWNISKDTILNALAKIKKNNGLMGRWECMQEHPRVVLDVAHNEHGIKALLEQLESLTYENLHIITGMVKDKDVQAVLNLLPVQAKYYFTQSHIPRALPVLDLVAKAKQVGLSGDAFDNVNDAIAQAIKKATDNDLILVIGSIFLVAEVNRSKFTTNL
jgi:dihydrofolate synthase/folylpolyglutamate synthase